MTTFSFYSFRILKISPYINFKKILGRILAPPSGRSPGADAPPAPLATPLTTQALYGVYSCVVGRQGSHMYVGSYTVTDLPTVKGFIKKCNGVYIIILLYSI